MKEEGNSAMNSASCGFHVLTVTAVCLSLQLFEANRVKFYMLNEVSEMIGHHGQVFRK